MRLSVVCGLLLIVCSQLSLAQTTFLKGQQFVPIGNKFYGGGGVNQLSDSSFAVVGVQKTGIGSSSLFLAKYATNGNLEKVLHSLNDSFFYVDLKSVTFLPDQTFWSIGTYYNIGLDTSQVANFHYDSEGNLLGSITQNGGYNKLIQINESLMAGSFVNDSTDSSLYNPNKELHIIRYDGSKVLSSLIVGDDLHYNGQNLYSERLVNDSLRWFRKIDMSSYAFIDSFSVTIQPQYGEFRFTKSEFVHVFYNPKEPKLTHFGALKLNDYTTSWSGNNGYIEGEKYTVFDFTFNASTYFSDEVYVSLALTNDDNGRTVIAKLMPNGKFELLKVNYRYLPTQFVFYPAIKTKDSGFFGLASDHFSPSTNFKIMKTDSLGQVLNSDYLDGVTFKIDTVSTILNLNADIEPITIFPNPSTGAVSITGLSNGVSVFKLTDLSGKMIFSFSESVDTRIDMELPYVVPGLYFMKITQDEQTHLLKLIIE